MGLNLETASAIARRLGLDERNLQIAPVTGGDIADATVIVGSDHRVFVKSMPLTQAGLLSAEADGLAALAAAAAIRVPRVLARGQAETEEVVWLALEYLELRPRDDQADRRLGEELAALHHHGSDHFGWHRHNYIGLMPQRNTPDENWARFFAGERLLPQLERFCERYPEHLEIERMHHLIAAWHQLADDHRPESALLHGDLWSGNVACVGAGQPVIYDPSVHYGDRECDLAMAALFGGFAPSFQAAYESAWPLPEGWSQRRRYYQLYHLLNHANLFGGSYINRVCADINTLITH